MVEQVNNLKHNTEIMLKSAFGEKKFVLGDGTKIVQLSRKVSTSFVFGRCVATVEVELGVVGGGVIKLSWQDACWE